MGLSDAVGASADFFERAIQRDHGMRGCERREFRQESSFSVRCHKQSAGDEDTQEEQCAERSSYT